MIRRYALGDHAEIRAWAKNNNETPSTPDAHPTAKVYSSAGSLVETITVPLRLSGVETGMFFVRVPLDSSYAVGVYDVLITWAISATNYGTVDRFEIVDGGSANGQAVFLQSWKSPYSRWMFAGTDQGVLKSYRNPRQAR